MSDGTETVEEMFRLDFLRKQGCRLVLRSKFSGFTHSLRRFAYHGKNKHIVADFRSLIKCAKMQCTVNSSLSPKNHCKEAWAFHIFFFLKTLFRYFKTFIPSIHDNRAHSAFHLQLKLLVSICSAESLFFPWVLHIKHWLGQFALKKQRMNQYVFVISNSSIILERLVSASNVASICSKSYENYVDCFSYHGFFRSWPQTNTINCFDATLYSTYLNFTYMHNIASIYSFLFQYL